MCTSILPVMLNCIATTFTTSSQVHIELMKVHIYRDHAYNAVPSYIL